MEEHMQSITEPETAVDKPRNKRYTPILIHRNFALLWSGQAISLLGDFIFNTTLVVWIAVELAKGQSWSPLAVSGVFLAASLPTLLFGPLVGVFVDRWDGRHIMIVADAMRALLIGLLLVAEMIVSAFRGGQITLFWQLGIIYGVVFLVNLLDQFFRPSMMALIGDIVEEPLQARAMGLGQASASLATLVGPALAPPLLLLFGVQWALAINACSFMVSFFTLLAIRSPRFARSKKDGQTASFVQDFREGLRFLTKTPILLTLLSSNVIALLGGGALYALDIFFVTQNLHTPAALYGLLELDMLVRQVNIIHFQHDFHSQATSRTQPGARKIAPTLRWQFGDGSKTENTGAIPQTRVIFFSSEHLKPKDLDIKRYRLLHILHKQFKS